MVPGSARGVPAAPDGGHGLFTDLYELTMLQAYVATDMRAEATFTLFVRELPPGRNFLVAAGLATVLDYLERVRFDAAALQYLATLEQFSDQFLSWLRDFRFSGSVHAVPEGTPVFANEPMLEVTAPLPQAQLIETFVMNQVHVQTVLASKAQRLAAAADGRAVVDFSPRRTHGFDAAMQAARASYLAGCAASSNVLAGQRYGIPVTGTMAHSFVQAHDDELAAFRDFVRLYPQTVLLVDTYDTLGGVRNVIALARELGTDFNVRAVRLDSGDLETLAKESRQLLDEAGLQQVEIFASGGLDEEKIANLIKSGAPIDGFGVGTSLGVSEDAPALDLAYKLSHYAGKGRLKLSTGKPVLPGPKQVFRISDGDTDVRDVIARREESQPGRPLLKAMMSGGRRTAHAEDHLEAIREYAQAEIGRLPAHVRAIAPATPRYPVEVSAALADYQAEVARAAAT